MNGNILFLAYWGLHDGLTQGSALPHIKALAAADYVKKILFVTLEREESPGAVPETAVPLPEKVQHRSVYLRSYGVNLFTKIADFVVLPNQLAHICRRESICCIIAHGAPAGALAYKVWQKDKVPFGVSLFEPHADYMLESGVWNRNGLKYIYQKRWEKRQKKHAAMLLPVTENYRQQLLEEGVPGANMAVVPCAVDAPAFAFDGESRKRLRLELDWQGATVGIYVGKYGGLYYGQEAFHIYKRCFEALPHFRLIILSPQPQGEIAQHLEQHDMDMTKVYIASAPHQQVARYLSAADFALATYKPGPSKKCLSPIKTGEYWANGLPVLLTEGVGDDSDIIRQEGGGAVFNLRQEASLEKALQQIQRILKDPSHRQEIPQLARKYRSPERIREAYDYFLGKKREPGP